MYFRIIVFESSKKIKHVNHSNEYLSMDFHFSGEDINYQLKGEMKQRPAKRRARYKHFDVMIILIIHQSRT